MGIIEINDKKDANNFVVPSLENHLQLMQAFCEKWIDKFSDISISHYQLIDDDEFPNLCQSVGWQIDNGVSFQNQYGCDSYEDALNCLSQVTDINLLGNLIFSYWRYFNHWAYSGDEILEHKEWFVKALKRLQELANDKMHPNR